MSERLSKASRAALAVAAIGVGGGIALDLHHDVKAGTAAEVAALAAIGAGSAASISHKGERPTMQSTHEVFLPAEEHPLHALQQYFQQLQKAFESEHKVWSVDASLQEDAIRSMSFKLAQLQDILHEDYMLQTDPTSGAEIAKRNTTNPPLHTSGGALVNVIRGRKEMVADFMQQFVAKDTSLHIAEYPAQRNGILPTFFAEPVPSQFREIGVVVYSDPSTGNAEGSLLFDKSLFPRIMKEQLITVDRRRGSSNLRQRQA